MTVLLSKLKIQTGGMIWKFGNSSKSKTEFSILELEFLEPRKCLNPRVFKIEISKNLGPVGFMMIGCDRNQSHW